MCVGVLPACSSVPDMHGCCPQRLREGIGSLGTRVQTVVSHNMGAGNQTCVLWKNNQFFYWAIFAAFKLGFFFFFKWISRVFSLLKKKKKSQSQPSLCLLERKKRDLDLTGSYSGLEVQEACVEKASQQAWENSDPTSARMMWSWKGS